jgi:hypothetical protein
MPSKESSLQLKRTQQANTENFILCGVVTATFSVIVVRSSAAVLRLSQVQQ